ncbi:MAG: T9SS type A sorting domain-containing protein [Candidatus Cloacimonadaceae bacterium]|jgi:hypothetical protein
MKQALILLLLTLAISLGAIVNLGDEYIGSTPMGQFRKTGETVSYRDYYGGDGDHDYTHYTYYYYNEFYPTRLDSIHSTTLNAVGGSGSKRYYEYTEFEDYYLVTETVYSQCNYPEPSDFQLASVCNYKYDYQDRILEYHLTMGGHGSVNRILYAYDANGNLLLKAEYNTLQSNTIPCRVTTWKYDEQNRNTYSQIVLNQVVAQTSWMSWSDHPLPDSTYTLYGPDGNTHAAIQKNYYDDNGKRHLLVSMVKKRSSPTWERRDTYYCYISAHGLALPVNIYQASGDVSDPDAPFSPQGMYFENYYYSDDYHTIDKRPDPYRQYKYDDNWLLTRSHYRFDGDSVVKTISWQYYGPPISSDDPTAVPQAVVTAYPNPARGNVNISLSKSSSPAPAEAKVYNIRGQLVRRLEVSDTRGDQYLYNWDCKDSNSHAVPTGVYFIRIKTNSGEINKKVTVIK